jgi:hypothetical protein
MYTIFNAGEVQAVKPQNRTTTVESSAIDITGYDGVLIEYNVGTSADTLSGSVYLTGTLTESATTGGSYAAVDASDYVGTLPVIDDPAEDDSIHLVAYQGVNGFIKVGFELTGTHTTGIPVAVSVFKTHKRYLEP